MSRTCGGCGATLPADNARLEVRHLGRGEMQMSNCFCDVLCWDAAEVRANLDDVVQGFAVANSGERLSADDRGAINVP